MKQFRISRQIQSVPVVAGGFATIQLPRTYDYESIFLRITGGLQVTVLTTAVRAEAPCQSVSRVEVIADGKNTLFSAPFWYTALGNYKRKITESGARATTPPSAVGVATYQVEAIGIIDLQTVDGLRSKDSNFRASSLSLFELKLTFGNPGDNFVGGTVVYNNLNVEVWVQEVVELPDADGKITSPAMLKKISAQEQAFAASNPNAQVNLPAGNLIRSVFVRCEGGVTAGEPSVATLNSLSLQNGVDVRMKLSGGQLRAKNNADTGQFLSGYFVADVCNKGAQINLTELWDVTGNSQPQAVLDVVGGANVRVQVVTEEYIPVM